MSKDVISCFKALAVVQRCFLILVIALGWGTSVAFSQDNNDQDLYFDSLRIAIDNVSNDDERLGIMDQIAEQHYNVDSTMTYALMEFYLARKVDNAFYEARGLRFMGWVAYYEADYPRSVDYYYRALAIDDSINNDLEKALCYAGLGNCYSMSLNSEKSNEFYRKSVSLFRQFGSEYSSTSVGVLLNFAQANIEFGLYDVALHCIAEVDTMAHTDDLRCDVYDMRGVLDLYRFSDTWRVKPSLEYYYGARHYFYLALDLADSLHIDVSSSRVANNLANLLLMGEIVWPSSRSERAEVLSTVQSLISSANQKLIRLGYSDELNALRITIARYLLVSGDLGRADALVDSLVVVNDPEKIESHTSLKELYDIKSDVCKRRGDVNGALYYRTLSLRSESVVRSGSGRVSSLQNMAELEYDRKIRQRDVDDQKRDLVYQERERQRNIVLFCVVVVLLLVGALFIVTIKSNMKAREANVQLDIQNRRLESQADEMAAQNDSLQAQKAQIEKQAALIASANKELMDSINYASLIQNASLPTSDAMHQVWGDCLIYYRPRDVVSGDFYWISQVGNYRLLAVADCTGHGVPGGFLSMLGKGMLDYLAEPDIAICGPNAGRILTDLREMIMAALHQGSEGGNQDGMDVALVIHDMAKGILHYAGAMRPVVYMHDGVCQRFATDRMPIGVHWHDENVAFKDYSIEVSPGDRVYLFSDGIVDQFGYDAEAGKKKKFTFARFKSILEDTASKDFERQRAAIDSAFIVWRTLPDGNIEPQTDDVCIVGLAL